MKQLLIGLFVFVAVPSHARAQAAGRLDFKAALGVQESGTS